MIGIGTNIMRRAQVAPQLARDYAARVAAGSGSIISNGDTERIYKYLIAQGTITPTQLLFNANSGVVQRIDGVLKYIRTAFDLSSTANNLDGSATATAQPRLVGGIAPNSKYAASNQGGEDRIFLFTDINFANSDPWSITMTLNWDLNNDSTINECFGGALTSFYLKRTSQNKFGFTNDGGAGTHGAIGGTNSLLGKYTNIGLVATGAGALLIYKNGVLFETLTTTTGVNLKWLFRGVFNVGLRGKYKYFRIQSGAMTAAQILSESTFLSSLYPEIESTVIGTQTWATRNFEAVCTPMGNVIPEMQTATAVARYTAYNIVGSGWINNGDGTYTATGLGSGSDLYLRQSSLPALPIGTWFKSQMTVTGMTAGELNGMYDGNSGGFTGAYKITANGTYTRIWKSTAAGDSVYNIGAAGFNGTVSAMSMTQLGWANATEIYDAVYAATAGDATAKTYAALKESGMWCYYNNDAVNGATYGKIPNGYARKLLKLDFASASFGYHVPTEAELTTLAANGGNALKYGGTDFWNTTGGTNTTSFTALGGASRSGTDGTFATIKETAVFGDDTGLKALTVNHNSDTVSVDTVDIRQGNSIRIIKD